MIATRSLSHDHPNRSRRKYADRRDSRGVAGAGITACRRACEWIANGTGSIALVSPDSWEHRHIRAGMADLEAGERVANERVVEWLDSWGTENELPAPK